MALEAMDRCLKNISCLHIFHVMLKLVYTYFIFYLMTKLRDGFTISSLSLIIHLSFSFLRTMSVACRWYLRHLLIGLWPIVSSGLPVPACIILWQHLLIGRLENFRPIRSSFENTFQCLWNTLDFPVHRIVAGARVIRFLSKTMMRTLPLRFLLAELPFPSRLRRPIVPREFR